MDYFWHNLSCLIAGLIFIPFMVIAAERKDWFYLVAFFVSSCILVGVGVDGVFLT
jgi:hypothetical protein